MQVARLPLVWLMQTNGREVADWGRGERLRSMESAEAEEEMLWGISPHIVLFGVNS